MIQLDRTVRESIFYQTDLERAVDAIVALKRVKLSEILKTSHVLCDNCCELYTPCHVGEWIKKNPELYDSEIPIFRELLELCEENIIVDIEPYTAEEINRYVYVSEVSPHDRLRQVYTMCLASY